MNRQRRELMAALIFSLPALAGLAVFVALPFLLAIVLSFTNLRLGSPLPTEWVGVQQYSRILTEPGFIRAIANNAIFALVVVPLQTCLALALALLVNRAMGFAKLFRAFFFLPVVFPLSMIAVVWILIFAPGANGMLNGMLDLLSFGLWEEKDFLHDPLWAFPAIMLTSIWQGVGFQMVILLAGLQAISQELYDSAAIDGANPWQQFLSITLPQLRNTLIFVMLVTTILAFRLFDQVQIMTRGGPHDTTTTVMFEAVRAAFERQQIGKAAAMTVILFLIVLMVTWLQRRLTPEEREIE